MTGIPVTNGRNTFQLEMNISFDEYELSTDQPSLGSRNFVPAETCWSVGYACSWTEKILSHALENHSATQIIPLELRGLWRCKKVPDAG